MSDPAETYVITDLQQIRALADPLRQQILGAFVAEPRTTKQVATILGQPPTKLYHHVDILKRAGLIELVATKPKRGTTERYLRAIAHRFTVDQRSLGGEASTILEESVAKAFAEIQAHIRSEVEAGECAESQTILALGSLRLSREDLPILQQRIMDVANELGGKQKGAKRGFYRYVVAVYPSKEE